MPVGPNKTTAGLGGSIPQVTHVGMTRIKQKQLFISPREIALMMDKTVKGGYGVLEAGTLMAYQFDASDVQQNVIIPYSIPSDDASFDGANDPSRSMLTSDAASGTVIVAMEDSYKFEIGDEIVVAEGDTPSYAEVTITDIDRDTSDVFATITTDAFTATAFTVANGANIYVKGEASGGNAWISKAMFVLDMDLDTGLDMNPGALGNVVKSNCILRLEALMQYDSQAVTDLGAIIDNRRFIIK